MLPPLDTMDKESFPSFFNVEDFSDQSNQFSGLDFNSYVSGNVTSHCAPFSQDGLPSFERPVASHGSVNSFIQSTDIRESIGYIDSLPYYNNSVSSMTAFPNGMFDPMDFLNTIRPTTSQDESTTTTPSMSTTTTPDMSATTTPSMSTTTTPSMSPNSDISEELQTDSKLVYWNGVFDNMNVTAPVISNSQSLDSSKCVMTSPEVDRLLNAAASSLSLLDANCNPTGDLPDNIFALDGIKAEPVDNVPVEPCDMNDISCFCGSTNPFCNCIESIDTESLNMNFFNCCVGEDVVPYEVDSNFPRGSVTDAFIEPEMGSKFLNPDLDSSFDIPCTSSANPGLSCDELFERSGHNDSFTSQSSCHYDVQEVEPPVRSVLSTHYDANIGSSVVVKTEPCDSDLCISSETELSVSFNSDLSISLTPRLRLVDMVMKDHCYTKVEVKDQPEAPVTAPSPLWNSFLVEDVQEVVIPAKRRPGRPRKSTTANPVEKQTKVPARKPAQKRQRSVSQSTSKRAKVNFSSSVRSDKREQHNRAERERRCALRETMFSVAGQCPEHILQLTSLALQAHKQERSEEVENDFTLKVMRKVDEYIKRGGYDAKSLKKSKKAQNYSKMIMLLGITYYITSMDRDFKKRKDIYLDEVLMLKSLEKRYKPVKVRKV